VINCLENDLIVTECSVALTIAAMIEKEAADKIISILALF